MAFQPVGLHSCVDLSPHPDYWWLSELGFAVQYFFSAPRYEDSLGYLPRQWVSVRPDNTDIIVRQEDTTVQRYKVSFLLHIREKLTGQDSGNPQ